MRIYVFKSESKPDLRAFAGDMVGSMLPENHGHGPQWVGRPDRSTQERVELTKSRGRFPALIQATQASNAVR
jgi:hypothetical protein